METIRGYMMINQLNSRNKLGLRVGDEVYCSFPPWRNGWKLRSTTLYTIRNIKPNGNVCVEGVKGAYENYRFTRRME